MALNLKFFNGELSSQITHTFNINNGDWLERENPLFFDVKLLTEALLCLEISEHGKVIGRVTGHTSDNTCALVH